MSGKKGVRWGQTGQERGRMDRVATIVMGLYIS